MCGSASKWAKIAVACAFVGMVLHIAGWATDHWMVYEASEADGLFKVYIGLWWQQICNIIGCEETETNAQFETDMFNAIRGLETVTMALAIFGTIVLFVYVLVEAIRTSTVAIVLMILFFIAGTCSAVGMILMLIEISAPYVVGYSFGLTTIASPFLLIAGTLLIPDVSKSEDQPLDRKADEPYRPPQTENRIPLSQGGRARGWTP